MNDSSRVAAGLVRARAQKYRGSGAVSEEDFVVVEEPLEVRVAGDTLAVTMRTPGNDAELALGFLHAEGLIESRRDVGAAAHCGRPDEDGYGNVIDVLPAAGHSIDVDRLGQTRRGTLTTSSCGVCGRQSVDDLLERCRPLNDETAFQRDVVATMTSALRTAQPNFERTGGLHAAAIMDATATIVVAREDVGRHNAVDKVVGRLLLDGALPARGHALVVSGRTSFEIVQKALAASIPLVVGVSAPSSLAIQTAERANVTLVGFARGTGFNVYAGAGRILG